jgi:hypothetical protein
MRYFTPERWARLQDVSERTAFARATREWEQALADYRQELNGALPRLPPALRRFAQRVCLHDATVLGEWQGRTRLHLLVRPEGGGDRLVLLTYTLVEPPRVTVAALPAELRSPQPVWMYDEVGVER